MILEKAQKIYKKERNIFLKDMPTIYTFQKEKLRQVVDLFLRTGANFEEKFPTQFKRPMRLIMQENIPMV